MYVCVYVCVCVCVCVHVTGRAPGKCCSNSCRHTSACTYTCTHKHLHTHTHDPTPFSRRLLLRISVCVRSQTCRQYWGEGEGTSPAFPNPRRVDFHLQRASRLGGIRWSHCRRTMWDALPHIAHTRTRTSTHLFASCHSSLALRSQRCGQHGSKSGGTAAALPKDRGVGFPPSAREEAEGVGAEDCGGAGS